ncbi:MAG: response regulator [Sideroxyarcus sp.]
MDNMEETGKHPTVLVRPTVMIVDDAEEMLMILESILAKEYSLKLFTQPKEALDYAFSNPPDLILLDVMMPEIDGFEACRRLKANPKVRDIPVIFLTAKNEDEYEEMGFSVGASDFIHKPINAPIVNARVKTHLKIKFVMNYLRNENVRLKESAKQASTELAQLTRMLWGSQQE